MRGRGGVRGRVRTSRVLVGVAWTVFGRRVELAALAVLAGVDRFVPGVLGEIAAASCSCARRCGDGVAAGADRGAAGAVRDADPAGVGAGGDRRGRGGGSV